MRWNKVISKWNSLFFFSVIVLIFFPQLLVSQDVNIRFDYIGVEDGLSKNTVFCILQDSKGFMWFGTHAGLNRYDGRSIIFYNASNTKAENGTFGNVINDICEDKDGKIWIGTDKGLLKFDPTREKFYGIADWQFDKNVREICVDGKSSLWVGVEKEVIEIDPQKNQCIGVSIELKHKIIGICCGDHEDLWIGTGNGLFKLGLGKEISGTYLKNEWISKIYKDSAKNVWVGTEDGKLFKYDKKQDKFIHSYKNKHGIRLNAISEDTKNNLWLGFNGDGVVVYSINKGELVKHFVSNFFDPRGLKDNYIHTIYKDVVGTIWVGTQSAGLNRYNSNKEKFTTYYNVPGDPNSPSGISIFSIFEDREGFIWIGTYDGELSRFNPMAVEKKFEHFRNEAFIRKSILSINDDSNGDLWIGTANGGLFHCIDRKIGQFEQVTNEALGKKRVRVIKKDQDGIHLWVGTEEKGIVKFNPNTKRCSDSITIDNGLSDNNINSIFLDVEENNIIWVGTAKGLNRADKTSQRAISVGIKENIRIFSIIQDPKRKNILWIGTDSIGLCRFDKKSGHIHNFTVDDDLQDNIVYGILSDRQENLWFSTNKGIAKFNTKKEKVERTFDAYDGLQANEFNSGAYLRSRSGHMYFGGIKGFSVFHPGKIIADNTIPLIHFTKLKIGNKEIKNGVLLNGKEVLAKSISETKKIELSYRQQPFTLEFAALDFNVPDRIKYKYKLEKDGELVSDGWIIDDYYTFTNLNSGKHIFNVWSTNSDGYFDLDNQTPAEIEIIIRKHFFDRLKPIIMPLILLFVIAFLVILSFYIAFKTRTKRRIEKLEMIESAIADVSKQEHIADVIFRMLDYIVYFFGFDYAAISVIDFLNSTLETSWGKTSKPELIDQNRWRKGFKCKLSEMNILTKVAKENQTIEDVDTDLIRVLVPIEFSAKGKDIIKAETNLVFGVVEAGFHLSTRQNIPEEMKIILDLFLNYCSSLFYRALKRSEKQIVEHLLRKSSEIEHHEEYLAKALANAVKLIGGDKGDISFFSFNENKIDVSNTPIFYNVDKEEDRKLFRRRIQVGPKKGIITHAAEMNHYYLSNDVKNDPYYIKEFEDVNSELAVPMRYFGRVIGVLNIYSNKKNFFNNVKADIIQIIADEAAKIFQKKKINQTIKNLVLPFHLFFGIENIYDLIINNIKDYFITEFVSIWERAEIGDVDKFKLFIACDPLKEKYNEFGLNSLKQDIFKSNRREIQLINFDKNTPDCGFNEFSRKYELKSMILVPIIVDQQVYGLINIFSKRELPLLFPEDTTFLNLIALKGAISAQNEKLMSSFIEISNSLPSENYDRILGNIADSARKMIHADLVILFKYDQKKMNFEATFSGYLLHPELKKILRHAKEEDHLVSYIIRKGSVWFENSDHYQKYINKIGRKHKGIHFKEDFWTRERIKSSVGIRLVNNDEPIGIMFFNYREEQRFDENTKRFIEAFSSLASSAIVNARYFDLIEKQKEKVEIQKAQLETQKEKLEFEYEEVFQKMKEMLPRATRTSFYQILEGINHDIRNFLIRLKQAIIDIEENSERLYKRERYTINVRIKDIERNIRNVTNLLKLFNFRNPGKEAININELIEELTYFFKTRESESIHFNTKELEDGIPIIICNKTELSMIIYNLFSNAVHAIVEKEITNGEIMITTDFIYGEYIIVVEDNGVGIDNEDISHIYEAGFSRKVRGLGIGLYFVYETLRESFWGTIECESHYGQWTKFTIKIPESVNYKED